MKGRSPWLAAAPVIGVGLAIVALAGAHVIADVDPLFVELVEAGILLVFATAVLTVGYRMVGDGVTWSAARRILSFVLGAAGLVGGLAGVFVVARLATGEPTPEPLFILAIGVSLGAGAGALIGYYLDRYEQSLEEQAELARRLTVLQRVLRHNIRNEAGIIEGVSADLVARETDSTIEPDLRTIRQHTRRVHRLAEKGQELADVWQSDTSVRLDLVPVVRDAVAEFRDGHPDMAVSVSLPEAAVVRAHPRIGLAFREALDNAARHNEHVTMLVSVDATNRHVVVAFEDTGSGIPHAELEPLTRGHERPLNHTTGIGLWLMYWLLERSNGDLSFSDRESGGTVVEMTLRAASSR